MWKCTYPWQTHHARLAAQGLPALQVVTAGEWQILNWQYQSRMLKVPTLIHSCYTHFATYLHICTVCAPHMVLEQTLGTLSFLEAPKNAAP